MALTFWFVLFHPHKALDKSDHLDVAIAEDIPPETAADAGGEAEAEPAPAMEAQPMARKRAGKVPGSPGMGGPRRIGWTLWKYTGRRRARGARPVWRGTPGRLTGGALH